jgi:nucleotide-binding universal stress UspA family protein
MTPLRTIAVGFDGSPDAQAALGWALRVAKPLGAAVVVVHAVGLLEHLNDPEVIRAHEESAWTLVGEAGLDRDRVRWHLEDGDPCSVLLRAATPPVSADLLVVGSRGQGAHGALPLGSTSHSVAEHSSVPLVIVPIGAPAG